MSIRLYVGNLPKEPVDRQALQALFADAGEQVTTKVIKDRKTGKCRGFAFVTVPTDEMADQLIEKHNGQTFMDSPLKIEKALPRAKGKSENGDTPEGKASNPETEKPSPPTQQRRNNGSGGGSSKSRRHAQESSSGGESSGIQPDPRWAADLARLKEMLAAQSANS